MYRMFSQEIIDQICTYIPFEKAWCVSRYAIIKIYDPLVQNAEYWINIKDTVALSYLLEHDSILMVDKEKLCRKACYTGRNDILKLLLKHGMNISNINFSIQIAANGKQMDTVKFLLESGYSVRDNYHNFFISLDGFEHLVKYTQYETIKFILENNYYNIKNDTKYIRRACDSGDINLVNLLLKHGAIFIPEDNTDAFSYACFRGKIEMVKLFLKYGYDADYNNNVCVKEAKKNNQTEIVKLLLDYGCKL